MNKIIEKCDVCINGSVVSKELLIKTFSSFVSSTIEDKQHNVGIVLHTGSVCFDAILLCWKATKTVENICPSHAGQKLYHTLDRQNPWTVEDFAVKVKKDMTFSGLFWGWRMQKFPELLIHQR